MPLLVLRFIFLILIVGYEWSFDLREAWFKSAISSNFDFLFWISGDWLTYFSLIVAFLEGIWGFSWSNWAGVSPLPPSLILFFLDIVVITEPPFCTSATIGVIIFNLLNSAVTSVRRFLILTFSWLTIMSCFSEY